MAASFQRVIASTDDAATVAVISPSLLKYMVTLVDESKANDDNTCSICYHIMFQPVETPCHHLFCEECFRQHFTIEASCPTCRTVITNIDTVRSLKIHNPSAYRMGFGSLQVYCPSYYGKGCEWKGDYSNMQDHINKSCGVHPIECRYCGMKYARSLIELHEVSCNKRSSCPYCNEIMKFDAITNHCNTVCEKAPVICTTIRTTTYFDEYDQLNEEEVKGCGASMERCKLQSHQENECPKRIINCEVPGCSYSGLPDSFDEHDTKSSLAHVRLLAKALVATQNKLSTTEQQLSTTRQELQQLRLSAICLFYVSHSSLYHLTPTIKTQLKELDQFADMFMCSAVEYGVHIYWAFGTTLIGYHCETEEWFPSLPSMTRRREGHIFAAVHTRLMVAGGKGEASVEVFDTESNKWSMGPSLSTIRYRAASCSVDDRVFVFGGTPTDVGGGVNTCEVYEESKDGIGRWKPIAPMPTARTGACAIGRWPENIFVMGGYVPIGDGIHARISDTVDEYDMMTNTWRTASWRLPHPMSHFIAKMESRTIVLIHDGTRTYLSSIVDIIGDYKATAWSTHSPAELWV